MTEEQETNEQDPVSAEGAREALPEPTERDLQAERITELEARIEQYKDQLLRKAAEFDNYKKRTESDSLDRIRFATEALLLKLLPVIDDFDRFRKMSAQSADAEALRKGAELIHQKLMKIAGAEGLAPYDAVGTPFDPALHDALLQIPARGVEPHTVMEEVEKGYKLHDKVLRHAKVIVAAAIDEGTPQEQS